MSKRTIVVVDDEPFIRQIIAKKLLGAGYDVHVARDGLEGIELVRTVKPNLVVTDYKMPKATGMDLCNACREDSATREMPIILLTGSISAAESDLQTEVEALGNIVYMSKPFSPRELLKKVGELAEHNAGND